MTNETKKEIIKSTDSGVVVSVWQTDGNIGMCFSQCGKSITWDDLDTEAKRKVVRNLYAAADFFLDCSMSEQKRVCAEDTEVTVNKD